MLRVVPDPDRVYVTSASHQVLSPLTDENGDPYVRLWVIADVLVHPNGKIVENSYEAVAMLAGAGTASMLRLSQMPTPASTVIAAARASARRAGRIPVNLHDWVRQGVIRPLAGGVTNSPSSDRTACKPGTSPRDED